MPCSREGSGYLPRMGSKGWRLPANEIEQLVLQQLVSFLRDRGAVLDALVLKRKPPSLVSAALERAEKLADACEAGTPAYQAEIVVALVQRITVAQEKVTVEIARNALARRLLNREAGAASESKSRSGITIEVQVSFRRRGVEAKLVIQGQWGSTSSPDPKLVKALARAHKWFGQIVRGDVDGIGAVARAERLDRAYVTRIVCLAFLAPEITKAIVEGRHPTELTAKRLINSSLGIPFSWTDQTALASPSDS